VLQSFVVANRGLFALRYIRSRYGWILLICVFAAVLTASLTFNYYLFLQAKAYYLELNGVHLDPLGLSAFPADAVDSGRTRVVFFGDSRAASWPAPSDQFQFINRGIAAQTTAQVAMRFDEHVRPLQPQILILQVGINDLKTIPLFPERKESIIANCKANIDRIVQEALDLGATVILTTIFPVGEVPIERSFFWSGDIALAVNDVNIYIASLASNRILVFDAYALLAGENGLMRPEYSRDELHINPTGYTVLNSALVDLLAQNDRDTTFTNSG
jgi:lysophospholipase L1-like esterase